MGAYSMNNNSVAIDVDALMASPEITAAYEESCLDAAARVVAETTANWNSIIEACAIDELNYLEENSVEMVYEGAKLDGFFAKAKEIFLGIWRKIQEIFKRVLAQFSAWFQSDKDFIKKYKTQLNVATNGGFGDKEVKFFDYTFYKNGADLSASVNSEVTEYKSITLTGILDEMAGDSIGINTPKDNDVESWKTANKKLSESDTKTDILDQVRGSFIYGNDSKKVEAGEFVKLLKEDLQGSDSKDDVKLANVLSDCITFLGWSDKIKANIGKLLTKNKKSIDNAIKALENIKKELSKELGKDTGHEVEGAKHSIATTVIDIMKSEKSLLVTANGVALQCLKACSRQSKAVCLAALSYKTPKNESGMFQQENSGSLLDNVTLI